MLDRIVAPVSARTPENTLVPLNDLGMLIGSTWNPVSLLRSVHPDPALRAAAETGEKEIASFWTSLWLNRDLYEAVSECSREGLDATGLRLVSHVLRDFHRSGVDQDEATRNRVRELREDLVGISQDFHRNIAEDVHSILLDDATELEGLPEDYVREHAPDANGRIRITTDYPDYNPFMTYARSARRREQLYKEFRLRGHPVNLETLDRLVAKRHELAALLGYPSWAAYASEDKMIKVPEAIDEFIKRVSDVAAGRARREYQALLERKRREESGAEQVFDWEKAYYEELVCRERFQIDSKAVRSYFEYQRVKNGVLSLSEDLFGVRFVPVEGAARWHDDVEVLDVVEGGKRVGRVYLDMHPRDGKFKHAALFPLVRGVKGKSIPEAALVCNFPNPRTTQGPALLEHDEVETFFHEFGHLLHQLFARDQDWVKFSGTATEWDFIEVPSQLYEEWGWDYDVLRRFAVHHETGEVIPEDLVKRMRKARTFGIGVWVRHQMFYAAVSLECYGKDVAGLDTSRVVREMQDRHSPFQFVDGTCFQASFGHLDEYSALYYTYMWSLVIEKDFFQGFKKDGAMSREAAARFREKVLLPGGSQDAADLVRAFLGRDYSFSAFETWLNAD